MVVGAAQPGGEPICRAIECNPDSNECVICFKRIEKPAPEKGFPCGHSHKHCEVCLNELCRANGQGKCPLCRGPVHINTPSNTTPNRGRGPESQCCNTLGKILEYIFIKILQAYCALCVAGFLCSAMQY